MMSWYVENLLRGSLSIKDGLMQSKNDFVSPNMNSDLYMDLLSVFIIYKMLKKNFYIE